LKIFGFSDHTPQFFPGEYYSRMRMFPDQLEDYCKTVLALREKYKGQIEIPLGLEVEYYPDIFDELLPRIQDAGIEYIILGQHWNGNEEGEPYNGRPSDDEVKLYRYCSQAMTAMEMGIFSYFCHPGLLNFTGDLKIYEKHMRQLCKVAVDTGTPVEINLLGIRENRHYPTEAFWAIAAEEGCKVVLGIDAHKAEEVADLEPEKKALELVEKYGLTLLETVPLKRI
jgi:histidinol-phosphatase (PHP family)